MEFIVNFMPALYCCRKYFQEALMNNLNSNLIEGNLVKDPLLRTTPKGTPVCTFCLASNRYYKQDSGYEKEVSFFNVQTWSKLAEICNNLGHKGRGVRVVGRLKEDRWNGSDGKAHSKLTIVAEHVEFRPIIKREEEKTAITLADNAALADAAAVDMRAAHSAEDGMPPFLEEASEEEAVAQEAAAAVF
jgi:single-strand DNA-binding protein